MLSLLIIVEITLFFDESQLQAAIALALTVMLVMYTMYQGISATLPKTAYLKFIDVWVFFCLLVPFIVFLIEVYWELTITKSRKKMLRAQKKIPGWTVGKERPAKVEVIPFRRPVQFITIFLTLSFIIGYLGMAVSLRKRN
jgi:hypothetical protein